MNTAFFVVTTNCTRACPYCFYVTRHQSRVSPAIDTPAALASVDTISRMGAETLIITGGEPLMRDDLEEIISRATTLGLQVLLLTNGDLLAEERIERLSRSGLVAISLSVDTASQGNGAHDVVPRGAEQAAELKGPKKALVKLALRTNLQVSAITAITKRTLPELDSLYAFTRSLSVGPLFGPAYIPRTHPSFAELSLHCLDPEQRIHFERFLEGWAEEYGASPYVRLIKEVYSGGGLRPEECLMGSGCFVVNADGTVLPCFHREDLPCGSTLANTPGEILSRLRNHASHLRSAPCFGEHCITMFTSMQ